MKKVFTILAGMLLFASATLAQEQILIKTNYITRVNAVSNNVVGTLSPLATVTNGLGWRIDVSVLNTNPVAVEIYNGPQRTNTTTTSLIGIAQANSTWTYPVAAYPDISGVNLYPRSTNSTSYPLIVIEHYGFFSGVHPSL